MSIFSIEFCGVHILTLASLAICFILTYWKLKIKFIHRVAIAGTVTMLGLWFYDLVWLLGIWNGHINLSRLLITIFLIQILLMYNYVFKFKFLHLNKTFVILMVTFFITMFGMFITG